MKGRRATSDGPHSRVARAGLHVGSRIDAGRHPVRLADRPDPPDRRRSSCVVNDTTLQAPGREEARREAVLRVIEPRFDFPEIARLALGRYWRARSAAERRQFVTLFSRLLARAYLGRILAYSGESVQYLGQTLSDDRATVRTRIVTLRETDVPVDYRLLRHGDHWLVYDMRIEGVSLVENYRVQFNQAMATSSFGNLLKKMEARLRDDN